MALVKRDGGDALLVAENLADDAVLIDARDGKVLQRFDLGRGKSVPNTFPYTVVVNRDGTRAWCSLWNGSSVAELDLRSGKVVREIALLPPKEETDASSHPTALLLSPDEGKLYVALANRDRVAMIATADGQSRTLSRHSPARPDLRRKLPIALAQSTDGKTLYVADSTSDAVAVFDLRESRGTHSQANAGPRLLLHSHRVVSDRAGRPWRRVVRRDRQGNGTGPNSGPETVALRGNKQQHPYIASLIRGSSRARQPATGGARPRDADRGSRAAAIAWKAAPMRSPFQLGGNPIRHVIYIIKENRTYDQIFGDIKEANGDPSLVMYGEDITPNQHKLARQFGVLDNFYDSGEVSGDGHPWSMAAITTDYNEKAWPIAYRGDEREYDSEGTVGDIVPFDEGIPDVNEPATGYSSTIWPGTT